MRTFVGWSTTRYDSRNRYAILWAHSDVYGGPTFLLIESSKYSEGRRSGGGTFEARNEDVIMTRQSSRISNGPPSVVSGHSRILGTRTYLSDVLINATCNDVCHLQDIFVCDHGEICDDRLRVEG